MKDNVRKLYFELRHTKKELVQRLNNQSSSIIKIIKDELRDVEWAIEKIENGTFGRCEISGELLPSDLLYTMPTAKTANDLQLIKPFFRKSLRN